MTASPGPGCTHSSHTPHTGVSGVCLEHEKLVLLARGAPRTSLCQLFLPFAKSPFPWRAGRKEKGGTEAGKARRGAGVWGAGAG